MNYWIGTDFHLGHENIKKYCGRPDDFEDRLLSGLSTIHNDDVFIFLGDFCIGNDVVWHNKLQQYGFKKWMILGNHDRKSKGWYLHHGWDMVCNGLVLQVYGKKVLFSHRPQPNGDYDINIHGHCHNNPREVEHNKQLLVYMEHGYKPFNLRKLIEKGELK